jgi:hypothetical protein
VLVAPNVDRLVGTWAIESAPRGVRFSENSSRLELSATQRAELRSFPLFRDRGHLPDFESPESAMENAIGIWKVTEWFRNEAESAWSVKIISANDAINFEILQDEHGELTLSYESDPESKSGILLRRAESGR